MEKINTVRANVKLAGCLFASLLFCTSAFAFTSISAVPADNSTLSWASNYDTQTHADNVALSACRAAARRNGHAKLAQKCAVLDRSRGPGYGALVCGDGGCAWQTGYESEQTAANAAYNACSAGYKNCQETGIRTWNDVAGFPRAPVAQPEVSIQPSMTDIYRARWCAKQNIPPSQCAQ
ncbi:hypothetical protein Bphy_6927 (plasmid) [Paraburkholderia phymatum STM815]|uniref:DUF4189 domain-containing protein n=1 Tax=Paraburkholderia phymatum (strain DSM 17167 / CIP 108236 / LMG 21445 / STM815) TaxID=391038 RepID=B2JTN4_PARP8|nr:hypothetical protein Bphy_6927 [Paraburkholderia phymatum STM815]